MGLAERLKAARKAADLTVQELARAVRMSPSGIYDLERGTKKSTTKIATLAEALKVPPLWLETGAGSMGGAGTGGSPAIDHNNIDHVEGGERVPLISWIRAGEWEEASDPLEPGEAEEWLHCPRPCSDSTFALRVSGESMVSPGGRSYPDGCIIFVDPQKKTPANGARVVAKLAGSQEVTFKTIQVEGGRVWLKPLNPHYPPIFDEFEVVGTVVGTFMPE